MRPEGSARSRPIAGLAVAGERDPLWAILTHPSKKGGRWEIGEFLATGEREVERLMELSDRLGVPMARTAALDYGCGVGRITRALASRFETVVGLDISAAMVARAAALNGDLPNARFQLTSGVDLDVLGTERFDLVYCALVLQHLPSHRLIEATIGRLASVLAPGRPTGLPAAGSDAPASPDPGASPAVRRPPSTWESPTTCSSVGSG